MSIRSRDGGALVIGEALIDIVEAEGRPPTEHVGGSPANVALGIARLGTPVRLHSALARDRRGHTIARTLRASGAEVDARSWSLNSTSTARARLDATGSAEYAFDIEWSIPEPPLRRGASLVHVGSLGMFLDPGASAVRAFVKRLPAEVVVTVDPNIRPRLLPDREGAVQSALEIAQRADVLKLSDEDAAWLWPGTRPDDVVALLLEAGARVIALTCGSKGAELASAYGRVHVPAPHVEVVDTVGAGDSFMAALAAQLLGEHVGATRRQVDSATLTRLGSLAARAAAITVTRAGADLPTRDDLALTGPTMHRRSFLGAVAVLAGGAAALRFNGSQPAAAASDRAVTDPTPPAYAGIVGVL